MIRALRPTDILPFVAFCHQVSCGSGDRTSVLTRSLAAVGVFLERSLALEPGRESWVQIEHGQISGLVSAKRREGADIWEIDQLIYVPSADAPRTCSRLLKHLLAAASDDGVQKVFLRLDSDNPALEWARQVGFVQYSVETIYHLPEVPVPAHPPRVEHLRPRRPADHQALFQLYCSAVPVRVRQAEGMTLHEWRWTDGWWLDPMSLQFFSHYNRVDYVVESTERLSGWLQIERRKRRITVLTDAREQIDVEALVRYGLTRLRAGGEAYCAVREYQPELGHALEEIGFSLVGSQSLLTRALATRIPEGKLVPVRAS
jgi:N-acetylglutamate synthase-like GNAT family acetyltransferase